MRGLKRCTTLMFWICSAATGSGHLTVSESTMSSSVDQSNLEANMTPHAGQLKLKLSHAAKKYLKSRKNVCDSQKSEKYTI